MTVFNHNQYYCNERNGMQLRSGTTINCLKTSNLYANFMLIAENDHYMYANYSKTCADAYCITEFLNMHREHIKTDPGLVEFYYMTKHAIDTVMSMIESKMTEEGIYMCGCDNPELVKEEDDERQAYMENGPGEFLTLMTPEYHLDFNADRTVEDMEISEEEGEIKYDWDTEVAKATTTNGNGYETVCWIPHDTTHAEFEDAMNRRHYSWRHNLQDVYDELRAHRRYFAGPHASEQDTVFKKMQTSILLTSLGV